jgi:HK97 family phage prohead protease
MRGEREVRQMPANGFEMREVTRDDADGSWVVCAGYFSLTCADMQDDSNAYEMEDAYGPWVESTVRGFATKTIREGCDTAFLVNHSGVTMARTKAGTLSLEERLDGGHYEGRLNPTRPDVQIIRAAVQDGAVDESSFAFRVVRQKWSDDYTRRWIQEIDLNKGDVSPVNYGANPHTGGHLSMRSAMALLASQGLTGRAWAMALREIRAGKTISQATFDALQPIHDYLSKGGDLADSLADLLDLDGDGDDDGDGDESRSTPLILPDYTSAAKAALARARR